MPQSPLAATIGVTPGKAQTPGQFDSQGNFGMALGHGKYFRGSFAKRSYRCANPSGVTTSAGLATTYLGLCLSNPAASTANLVVQRVTGQMIVAPSTVTGMGLIVGFSAAGIVTHTTALTPISNFIGSGTANMQGLVDSACTLVGASANAPSWAGYFAETLIATDLASFVADIDGEIVIPPGGYCAIGTTIAGPASGFVGSFSWEEVGFT